MTAVLLTALGLLLAYGIYIATLGARVAVSSTSFFDADANIPGWATVFAGAGIVVAGLGLPEFLTLTRRFGLQFSHTAVGLIIVSLTAVLIQKRLWIAARVFGLRTPGEALGRYYQSITLRLAAIVLALLFGLPFAAAALHQAGEIITVATAGTISKATAIWALSFFLFLSVVIGGWRSTVHNIALLSVFVGVLLVFVMMFAGGMSPEGVFMSFKIPVEEGIMPDKIPGVVQYSAGIGKDVTQGGIWTSVAIGSASIALIGLILNPGFLYLGMTTRQGRAFAFGPVWMIAGLLAFLLIVVGPFLAAGLGADTLGFVDFAISLQLIDPLLGVAFYLLLLTACQIAVVFFVNAGSLLITRDLFLTYILPGLSDRRQVLTARITLAAAYILIATLAAYAPLTASLIASLALPLTVQLFPAFLGLAFVPWISRSAVLAGFIIGCLLVTFTEPPGLVLFEGLFVELPWGRWPLTIHSAAWGLAFNIAAALLASIFTRKGQERSHRDRLHAEFAARWRADFGGQAARGAKWSLTLIWAFLAIGPGAILGNSFFSHPIFTKGGAELGIPSLWVWQILFWLIGVPLVWWLAYRSGLGITTTAGLRKADLGDQPTAITTAAAPRWIARSLERVSTR